MILKELIDRIACRMARRRISLGLDRNADGRDIIIDPRLRNHLETCRRCAVHLSRLQQFRNEYLDVVEQDLANMAPPDFSKVYRGQTHPTYGKSRMAFLVRVSAAAVLAVSLFLGGFYSFRALNTRKYIRVQATRFVDDLFSQTLYSGESASGAEDHWSVSSVTLDELILPSPYELEIPF